MNKKQLMVVCGILLLTGCASASGKITERKGYVVGKFTIPFNWPSGHKRQFTTKLGLVYEGMPKENLKKVGFTDYNLIYHDKQGKEEYMAFSDWTTPQEGDAITFYILDGKVSDWLKDSDICNE